MGFENRVDLYFDLHRYFDTGLASGEEGIITDPQVMDEPEATQSSYVTNFALSTFFAAHPYLNNISASLLCSRKLWFLWLLLLLEQLVKFGMAAEPAS